MVFFYVYQQIYPFYSLAVVMSGTGFPIVISKFIAEADARNNAKQIQSVFWHAFLTITLLSLTLFICLFTGAPLLAGLMGDGRLAGLLRMSAFIYLFVPLLSVLRGSFQGRDNNMVPTAVSQVGEQAVRVSLILGCSLFLYIRHGTPYRFGAAATFGSVAAPAASTCILIFFSF
ncbi:oligosaccharide flippase family protein [Terrilactibacillus sp. S3-3]|nr:oligosaccharide flippase family protein [Terrilactibacillus sp. S3-3]